MSFIFKPKDCQNSPWNGTLGMILRNGDYFCEVASGSSVAQAENNRDILLNSLSRFAHEESHANGPFVISRVHPNNPKFRQFYRTLLWIFPVWGERADATIFKTKSQAMDFADKSLYGTVEWSDIETAKEPRLS